MKRNPFDDETARLHSNYCLSVQRELKYLPKDPEIAHLTLEVFEELQRMVMDEDYACTGAQAAFRQESYRLGVYPELGSAEATAGLARDLFTFAQEQRRLDSDFTTFIAAFAGPRGLGEAGFERRLWEQLQRLHEADREHHAWAEGVSADPDDPQFSYSFAGAAFFVVGLHGAASRESRRFPYPLLVFNAHAQFERLRESGAYGRMQEVIRTRDAARQGSINPMLDDFGRSSEARQYAGRAVEEGWRCPFHAAAATPGTGRRRAGRGAA